MKLANRIKKLFISLYQSLKRFPVTILLTTAVTIMLIVVSEYSKSGVGNAADILRRITMVLSLGIPVSLCLKFIFERYPKINTYFKIALYTLFPALLIIYYLRLLPDFRMVAVSRYTGFSIALYIAAAFFPFLFNKPNFELYIIKLLSRIFVTILFSVVIYIGTAAILFTTDKLLGVHVYSMLYYYSWLIIAGIFAPSYFLAGIPLADDLLVINDYPKVLKILLLYIAMPIISIYTFILYLYLGKILITFKWPVGMVGNLVLWYALISTFVIFLASTLATENRWVRIFTFWFIKFVLPLIAVMFISLFMRINTYGITENRYYVIILGLWVIGIMLYLNISKYKKNIIIPVSLAIIAFISVWGPWSSFSASINSQNLRLDNILARYGMIQDNKIVKASASISENDQREIAQILNYFNSSHSFKEVKYLPGNFKMEDMKNVFGFDYMDSYNLSQQYFSYSMNSIPGPLNIKGYEYLFNFRQFRPGEVQEADRISVFYNPEIQEIKISIDGKEIYSKSLSQYVKAMNDKYGYANKSDLEPKDMIFTDENNIIQIKYVFYNVYGNKDNSSDNMQINNIEFDMLVKIK